MLASMPSRASVVLEDALAPYRLSGGAEAGWSVHSSAHRLGPWELGFALRSRAMEPEIRKRDQSEKRPRVHIVVLLGSKQVLACKQSAKFA